MFAFIKFAGQITTPGAWQRAQPLRFFSVSSPISYLAHKLSKDPEKRRKQLDEHNAYYKKKYDEDEDYREQRRQSHRESVQAMSDHERRNLRRQNAFFNWVIRGAKNGVVCSPTHTPEHTLVKTTRKCAQCGHYRNKRLWWKRNNTHGSYDCHICFKGDWSRVRATGYKHRDLYAEREQKLDAPSEETSGQVKSSTKSKF